MRRFGIVKGRLQWGLCCLSSCLLRLLFAALQALAHPFAHLWLVTHPRPRGQRIRVKRTKPVRRRPSAQQVRVTYNVGMAIPREIQGQKYISLTTFRKNGIPVATPVWFGEADDKIYVMTRSDSGKYKRIRNNPHVLVAACTMRGKITGPTFAATARILPEADWPVARKALQKKYWLARITFLWSKKNVYVEVSDFKPNS